MWNAQAHDSAEKAVVFVSNNQRGKDNAEVHKNLLACTHVRCMVLRARVLLTNKHTHPFSPTHTQQTDTGSSVKQRLRTKQAGREASWPKEVRRVKRVVKSEK